MTELTSNNKILESLQKKQSLNTTIIRILLAGLTIIFFAFIPIGLSSSQSVILIISAGIGFIGNIIASYLVNKNKLNIGMLISIFSFNIAYLGISAIYKNLGALSFLLIIVPTTILIFSYLSDNLKVPVFITTNILGLLAVLFDFFLRNLPSRIYLQENTLQLIYTIYLVLIVFISAIYIINYLRLIKYFPIKSRMDSNQSIALTLGISLILLLVFANNYSSSISESQSEISSSIDQISYSIENFYNKQSLSIQNTAELTIFTEYIENEYLNNLSIDQQNNIESSLDIIKSDSGYSGNNFVAAVLDGNGNLLAISDSDKLNFFKTNDFFTDNMKTEPYITDFKLSSNSNFSYMYFTFPINNRYSSANGVLVYAFNYLVLENLIKEISFFNNSDNYAIIMDKDFVQLYNGNNNEYSFTIPLIDFPQVKIDQLIQLKKLPENYNQDIYPYNNLFSSLLYSLENDKGFNAIYEGDNNQIEKYIGVENKIIKENNFIIASLIPYSNIHTKINQSILIYFILGTILSAFYIIISQSNTLAINQGIKEIIKNINNFIETNKISSTNYNNYDEIFLLNNDLKKLEDKFQSTINQNETQLYSETSSLNKKILDLKNISSISIEISHLINTNKLLHQAVELINQKFDFYHTCIFIFKDDYLHYFTGSGQEGFLLKESNYKINVLADTPICEALRKNFAIAGSIYGKYLSHPLLQDSLDELAIPIKVENQILGVLNIHSYNRNSFSGDDFFIFQNLANQLGIYYSKNQKINSLEEKNQNLEFTINNLNQENLNNYLFTNQVSMGYKYNLYDIQEINNENEVCRLAWEMKKVVISNNFQSLKNIYPNTVALPIFDNKNVINVISVSYDSKENLEANLPLLIKFTEEIGKLLGKLRLIDQFNLENNNKQLIDTIIKDIFSSPNLDEVLQNASKSIGEKFDIPKVEIQINKSIENQFGEINE